MWDSLTGPLLLLALCAWLALWILRELDLLGVRRGMMRRGRRGLPHQPTSVPKPPGPGPSTARHGSDTAARSAGSDPLRHLVASGGADAPGVAATRGRTQAEADTGLALPQAGDCLSTGDLAPDEPLPI